VTAERLLGVIGGVRLESTIDHVNARVDVLLEGRSGANLPAKVAYTR